MAYWLLKTEPEEFSWDDCVKRGAKGEPWSGVRNFTARRHLKEMKKGEEAFFYHTGDEKQIVGIAEIIREAHPDPSDEKGVFVMVDVKAVKPLPDAGDARRGQGRSEAQGDGADQICAALGAASDRRRMGARLPHGRPQGVTSHRLPYHPARALGLAKAREEHS